MCGMKVGEGWHGANSAGSPWSFLEKNPQNPSGKRSWVTQQPRDELGTVSAQTGEEFGGVLSQQLN